MSTYINDPTYPDTNSTPDSGSGPSPTFIPDRAGSNDHEDEGGKKKKQGKRRKVNHACLYCRRSHMTCDEGRPCQRWYVPPFLDLTCRSTLDKYQPLLSIKREIGHLCHDERRTTPKDKNSTTPQQSQPPQPQATTVSNPPIDVARGVPGKHTLGSMLCQQAS